MAKRKAEAVYTWRELQDAIIEAIEKQRKITDLTEDLNLLKRGIKDTMLAEGLEEYKAGPDNNYGAKLVRQITRTWSVELLKETFPARVFRALCPPTPNTAALNHKLASLEHAENAQFQSLKSCAKESERINLVLEDPLVKIVETKGKK